MASSYAILNNDEPLESLSIASFDSSLTSLNGCIDCLLNNFDSEKPNMTAEKTKSDSNESDQYIPMNLGSCEPYNLPYPSSESTSDVIASSTDILKNSMSNIDVKQFLTYSNDSLNLGYGALNQVTHDTMKWNSSSDNVSSNQNEKTVSENFSDVNLQDNKFTHLLNPEVENSAHPKNVDIFLNDSNENNFQIDNKENNDSSTSNSNFDTISILRELDYIFSNDEISPVCQYKLSELCKFLTILSNEKLIQLAAFSMFKYKDIYTLGEALMNSDPASRRVMVRGLRYFTSDKSFYNYFSKYGQLENAAIIRHADGKSQGFGFLIYKDRRSAVSVINTKHVLDDKLLTVKFAAEQSSPSKKESEATPGVIDHKKLFIRNICSDITEDILLKEFETYGPIEECAIIRTTADASKGYGFITYKNYEDAAKAVRVPFRIIHGWVIFVAYSTGKVKYQQTKNSESAFNSANAKALNCKPIGKHVFFSPNHNQTNFSNSINTKHPKDGRSTSKPLTGQNVLSYSPQNHHNQFNYDDKQMLPWMNSGNTRHNETNMLSKPGYKYNQSDQVNTSLYDNNHLNNSYGQFIKPGMNSMQNNTSNSLVQDSSGDWWESYSKKSEPDSYNYNPYQQDRHQRSKSLYGAEHLFNSINSKSSVTDFNQGLRDLLLDNAMYSTNDAFSSNLPTINNDKNIDLVETHSRLPMKKNSSCNDVKSSFDYASCQADNPNHLSYFTNLKSSMTNLNDINKDEYEVSEDGKSNLYQYDFLNMPNEICESYFQPSIKVNHLSPSRMSKIKNHNNFFDADAYSDNICKTPSHWDESDHSTQVISNCFNETTYDAIDTRRRFSVPFDSLCYSNFKTPKKSTDFAQSKAYDESLYFENIFSNSATKEKTQS